MLTTRARRLGLPRDFAARMASTEPAFEAVHTFVDRLTDLPLDSWLEVGRTVLTDIGGPHRARAFMLVSAAIAEHGLAVDAWYVRDAVETSVCIACAGHGCWTGDDRIAFAAAHGAAGAAALALLARQYISVDDMHALSDPFANAIAIAVAIT